MSREEGGGGYSLIQPKWLCAAKQDMVFRVLSIKQGMFLHWKILNHSPAEILQKNAF